MKSRPPNASARKLLRSLVCASKSVARSCQRKCIDGVTGFIVMSFYRRVVGRISFDQAPRKVEPGKTNRQQGEPGRSKRESSGNANVRSVRGDLKARREESAGVIRTPQCGARLHGSPICPMSTIAVL